MTTRLILDPATGTGGFLLTVLDHIRESVTETYGTGEWNQYVNAELVKRIFGFELLVAPYTIGTSEVESVLCKRKAGMPMNVSVSISPIPWNNPQKCNPHFPLPSLFLTRRTAALSVKRDEPLLVILGNPPYPRDSMNPSRVGRRTNFYRRTH